MQNRALRILPAYWLALMVTALVAFPDNVLGYVLPRLVFLGDPLVTSPVLDGRYANASLWTLGIEVTCYLALATVSPRWLGPFALGIAVVSAATVTVTARQDVALVTAFAVGALGWTWRARIAVTPVLATGAACVTVAGVLTGTPALLLGGIAYLALCAAWCPLRWHTDLSYGVYVLAAPAQSLLAIAGVATGSVLLFVGASIAVALPLALASWTFVERPALSRRRAAPAGA